MPDWLNLDEPTQNGPPPRRRAQPPHAAPRPRGARPWWIVGAVLLGGAAIIAAYALPGLRQSPPLAQPVPAEASTRAEDSPATTGPITTGPGTTAPSTDAPAPPATSSTAASLDGRALAEEWLRRYLTRSDRSDTAWTSAVQPLTSESLLDELIRGGPEVVGFTQLTGPWRVTKMSEWDPPMGMDASGPSRQVTGTLVSVTDDQGHTVDKGIVLTAYLSESGAWLVSMVETPYESEG